MADISSNLYSWSTTAASNAPAGTTTIGSGLDDNLREIQKVVRTDLAFYNSAAVASAGTVDLGAQSGNFLDISGTTTITAFGTVAAGIWKVIRFQGALTLTHNATSLILPSAANITTAANDRAFMYSLGSGNWVCAMYERASGVGYKSAAALGAGINALTEDTAPSVANDFVLTYDASASTAKKVGLDTLNIAVLGTEQASTSGTSIDFTSIPSGVKRITVMFVGVSISGTSPIMVQLGDSGGVEATGYSGSASNFADAGTVNVSNHNTGFLLLSTITGAGVFHGQMILSLENSTNNTWVESSITGASNGAAVNLGGGSKALSATLDRVRITTVGGTDTFDAGAINISYE